MVKNSSALDSARAIALRMGLTDDSGRSVSRQTTTQPSSVTPPTPSPDETSSRDAAAALSSLMGISEAAASSQPLGPTSDRDGLPAASQTSPAESISLRAPRLSEMEGTALHGLLMDASEETSDRLVAVFGSHLTDAVRCLARLVLRPPRRGNHVLDQRLEEARSVPDLVAVLNQPEENPRDLVDELGKLQARVKAAQTAQEAAERAAFNDKMQLETAELLLRQSSAKVDELSKSLMVSERLRFAIDRQMAAMAANLQKSDEVVAQVQARLASAETSVNSLLRKMASDRALYTKNLAVYSDRLAKLHQFLAQGGGAAADKAQCARLKDIEFTLARTLKANRFLRQHIDEQNLDPDTLLFLSDGGALDELDFGTLGLDSEAVEIVRDVVRELNPSLTAKAKALELAKLVHHIRDDLPDYELNAEVDADFGGGSEGEDEDRHGLLDSSASPSPSGSASGPSGRLGKRSGPSTELCGAQGSLQKVRKIRSSTKLSGKALTKPSFAPSNKKTAQTPSGAKTKSKLRQRSKSKSRRPSQAVSAASTPSAARSSADTVSLPATPRSTASSASEASTMVLSSPSSSVIELSASDLTPVQDRVGQRGGDQVTDSSRDPPRRKSTRAAAARSREGSQSILAQESVDNDFLLGLETPLPTSPDSSPLGSPCSRYGAISEEEKEGEDPAEMEQPHGTGSRSQTPVSDAIASRIRQRHVAVPMSALDPSVLRSASSRIPPHVTILATLSSMPGSNPNAAHPATSLPPPIQGWQPLVKPSKKLVAWASDFLKPGFRSSAAQMCWYQIINFRTPTPIPGDLVARVTLAAVEAFAGWRNDSHPYQQFRKRQPDHACLFDVEPFMPDKHISIRAPKPDRVVKLWRQTHGIASEDTESDDLGFALWEHGHWILLAAIERAIAALAKIHGEDSVIVRAIRAAWRLYLAGRDKRSDNLRNKEMQFWKWCLPDEGGESEVPAEFLFEPSRLVYSLEVLPWVPTSSDWCAEVTTLDSRQPWRNCWIDVPSEHPFNTTFVPCNPSTELFVPAGMTDRDVGRAVVVNSELPKSDIKPGWYEMVKTWSDVDEDSEDSVQVDTGLANGGVRSPLPSQSGASDPELPVVFTTTI